MLFAEVKSEAELVRPFFCRPTRKIKTALGLVRNWGFLRLSQQDSQMGFADWAIAATASRQKVACPPFVVYQNVFSREPSRIFTSRVTSGRPSAFAVAAISRSAGSLGKFSEHRVRLAR